MQKKDSCPFCRTIVGKVVEEVDEVKTVKHLHLQHLLHEIEFLEEPFGEDDDFDRLDEEDFNDDIEDESEAEYLEITQESVVVDEPSLVREDIDVDITQSGASVNNPLDDFSAASVILSEEVGSEQDDSIIIIDYD
jgi:hypothetical protein